MTASGPPFVIEVSAPPDGDVAVVTVRGEFDLVAAPALDEAVAGVTAGEVGRQLVIDLTGTTFIDSSGLQALIRAARTAGGGTVTFRLSPTVRALVDMAGVQGLLGVDPGPHP